MEGSLQSVSSFAHIPDQPSFNRSKNRGMSSVLLNTRFGVRTYTIRPESPRTKQALRELGIDKQDYHLRFFLINVINKYIFINKKIFS